MKSVPDSDIIFPYKIYFQLFNDQIASLPDKEFFEEVCRLFKSKKQIGTAISESVKNFDFSEKNLVKLLNLVKNKEKNFSPSYYSNKCVTTGLLIFLLKDVLEFSGVLPDKRNNPYIMFHTLKYRLDQTYKILDSLKDLGSRYSNW